MTNSIKTFFKKMAHIKKKKKKKKKQIKKKEEKPAKHCHSIKAQQSEQVMEMSRINH